MPRVLVADPIAPQGIAHLRAAAEVDVRTGLSPAELLAIIGDYDALIVRSETRVTEELLRAGTGLRVVGRAGVGVDNIDLRASTERGILVVNSPYGNTTAAAELTIALVLALARRIPEACASVRAGLWARRRFVGTEVYGKTLGVIGFGKIGREVARRARSLEMTVIAYDPFANQSLADTHSIALVELGELLRRSDFITLHVPLNDETRGMIGADEIALMKDGARVVNCARGGLMDEEALAQAVRGGKLAGAAVDVFAGEPPGPDNPLIALPEVIVTPHLGASTEEAQVAVALDVCEQIAEVLAGRPARSPVNMPQLTAEAYATVRPYLQLGRSIGSLHAQLARDLDGSGRPVETVEVLYGGDFANQPTQTITRSVLAGLLDTVLSEPANLVNAPVLAAARGIKVTESQTPSSGEYSSLLTVSVTTPEGPRTVCGTAFGPSYLRIVHVDGYEVMFNPAGTMLITTHSDRPGMIGSIGTLLGQNNVNIAGLHLGREQIGGLALMVLLVDDPIGREVLDEIRRIPGMETARVVTLG